MNKNMRKGERMIIFIRKAPAPWSAPTSVARLITPHRLAGGSSTSCAPEGLTVKSLFDFIGRTEASRAARRWS
ncbi:hypothetical protein [Bacillus sp. ISL-37]|uniref:hypothetical protein n=1 Tax=Bacillus sp. ISL-37 TaxID=2819123 RepID=UPI001BE6C228|nr:hypothetical protein [Bacillus sp. ISL-37]